MKKIFILMFFNVIILINGQENIFIDIDSHKEIIDNFLDSIKNNDFESTISLFDWDVIEFDYIKYSMLMISISPISSSREFPKINYYNKILRKSNHIKEIETFISNLLLPEKYYNFIEGKGYPWPTSNSDTFTEDIVIEFLEYFDFDRLKEIEIIAIELSEPRLQFSLRHQNNMKIIFGEIYGYLDYVEYNILYSFEGKKYFGAITLCKYGNKWYIHHLSSLLSNIYFGKLIEMD